MRYFDKKNKTKHTTKTKAKDINFASVNSAHQYLLKDRSDLKPDSDMLIIKTVLDSRTLNVNC